MPRKSPQNRYRNALTTRRLKNGQLVYNSAIPKGYRPSPGTDVTIPATDVLRMDKLAHDIYGSPIDWWKIAAANRRVDGSLYFRPGSDIILPQD